MGGRGRARGASIGPRNPACMPVFANVVTSAGSSLLELANRVVTDRDIDAVSGLNDDQWRVVLHLLNAGRRGATETLINRYIFKTFLDSRLWCFAPYDWQT